MLGPPEIERDGVVVAPPRGHKAWAVLAYVLLAERPVARGQLAGLIFGDADDPRGALRWTLVELRRALAVGGALWGDPLEPGLPTGAAVDVLALASGDPDPALARGELLEGVDPVTGADFEAWLLVERRRFAGVCEAVLRDAALGALAAGAPLDAAALASRALALNGFDDGVHELLVRCLARAGDVAAAREHADACEVLFRRELGRAPDPAVRRAADEHGGGVSPPRAMYLLGHADPKLTMRVYQQVLDMDGGAPEQLEQLLGCSAEEAFVVPSGREFPHRNRTRAEKRCASTPDWRRQKRRKPALGAGFRRSG